MWRWSCAEHQWDIGIREFPHTISDRERCLQKFFHGKDWPSTLIGKLKWYFLNREGDSKHLGKQFPLLSLLQKSHDYSNTHQKLCVLVRSAAKISPLIRGRRTMPCLVMPGQHASHVKNPREAGHSQNWAGARKHNQNDGKSNEESFGIANHYVQQKHLPPLTT